MHPKPGVNNSLEYTHSFKIPTAGLRKAGAGLTCLQDPS